MSLSKELADAVYGAVENYLANPSRGYVVLPNSLREFVPAELPVAAYEFNALTLLNNPGIERGTSPVFAADVDEGLFGIALTIPAPAAPKLAA